MKMNMFTEVARTCVFEDKDAYGFFMDQAESAIRKAGRLPNLEDIAYDIDDEMRAYYKNDDYFPLSTIPYPIFRDLLLLAVEEVDFFEIAKEIVNLANKRAERLV